MNHLALNDSFSPTILLSLMVYPEGLLNTTTNNFEKIKAFLNLLI